MPSLEGNAFAKHCNVWPYVRESAHLVLLRAMKDRVYWLAAAIVNGIATACEGGFDSKAWQCAVLGYASMEDCKLDLNLMAEVAAIGREAFATTRVAAAMDQKVVMHKAWADATRQCRYYLAARMAFARSNSLALAPDGARFPGREKLITAAMNLDTNACAWAPPQAIREA